MELPASFTLAATGNLCLLGTLRSDGFPRISPIEPRIFEGMLVIAGMPNTTKFNDLARDPKFWQGGLGVIERMIGELEALDKAK